MFVDDTTAAAVVSTNRLDKLQQARSKAAEKLAKRQLGPAFNDSFATCSEWHGSDAILDFRTRDEYCEFQCLEFTLTIHFPATSGPLGLNIKEHPDGLLRVFEIAHDTYQKRKPSAVVQIGDVVEAVEGQPVKGRSFEDVVALINQERAAAIKDRDGIMTMRFWRILAIQGSQAGAQNRVRGESGRDMQDTMWEEGTPELSLNLSLKSAPTNIRSPSKPAEESLDTDLLRRMPALLTSGPKFSPADESSTETVLRSGMQMLMDTDDDEPLPTSRAPAPLPAEQENVCPSPTLPRTDDKATLSPGMQLLMGVSIDSPCGTLPPEKPLSTSAARAGTKTALSPGMQMLTGISLETPQTPQAQTLKEQEKMHPPLPSSRAGSKATPSPGMEMLMGSPENLPPACSTRTGTDAALSPGMQMLMGISLETSPASPATSPTSYTRESFQRDVTNETLGPGFKAKMEMFTEAEQTLGAPYPPT
jgi:hypothetical protein